MAIILLAWIFLLLFLRSFPDHGLRKSIIQAYLLLMIFVAVSTEVLSYFNLITRTAVMLAWTALGLIFFTLLLIRMIRKQVRFKDLFRKSDLVVRDPLSKFEILTILVIGLILITTLVIALAAPPNNFDSMTYHMSRVSNWIQNKNINYYPTAIDRQNYFAPLAEFSILHTQLFSQSDFYANLVQWSAFVIIILLSSEVAAELKVSRRGQILSALFAATIPMAILQSTSTQNDLFSVVGCFSFAYFLLRAIKGDSWKDVLLAGIALGAALMTKGTSYIYCAAIGIPLGLFGLFQSKRKYLLMLFMKLGLVILVGLVINLGVYLRNWDQYSHPLSTETNRLRNEEISLEGLSLNLVRNGLIQVAVPFQSVNQRVTNLVENVFGELNKDPRYIFGKYSYQVIFTVDEDLGSNLPHFLILLAALLFYLRLDKRDQKDIGWLFYSLILSSVLFSVTLKWQPWGSRLQLPVFILGAPYIGFLMDRNKISLNLSRLFVVVLSIYTIPYLVLNSSRPLVPIFPEKNPLRMDRVISNSPLLYELFSDIVQPYYADKSVLKTPRDEQYFTGNLRIYPDYSQVLEVIQDLKLDVVGLELNSNSWEYPIWVSLDRHAQIGKPVILHVGEDIDLAENNNSNLGFPEYIITAKGEDSYFLLAMDYKLVLDTKYLDLIQR